MAGKSSKATTVEDVKKWILSEWNDENKFSSNLKVARAFTMFFGSVLVIKTWGEALFAA